VLTAPRCQPIPGEDTGPTKNINLSQVARGSCGTAVLSWKL